MSSDGIESSTARSRARAASTKYDYESQRVPRARQGRRGSHRVLRVGRGLHRTLTTHQETSRTTATARVVDCDEVGGVQGGGRSERCAKGRKSRTEHPTTRQQRRGPPHTGCVPMLRRRDHRGLRYGRDHVDLRYGRDHVDLRQARGPEWPLACVGGFMARLLREDRRHVRRGDLRSGPSGWLKVVDASALTGHAVTHCSEGSLCF